MAVEVAMDRQRDLVNVKMTGPVGAGEFLSVLQRVLSLPEFHPGMRILVDMLEHVHQVTGDDMKTIAAVLLQKGEAMLGTEVAVVVSRPVSYGMTRMLQALIEDAPFRLSVFYSMEEARKSLGLA